MITIKFIVLYWNREFENDFQNRLFMYFSFFSNFLDFVHFQSVDNDFRRRQMIRTLIFDLKTKFYDDDD